MIILPIITTSVIHFSVKGWENVLFELGSERVNTRMLLLCDAFRHSIARAICFSLLLKRKNALKPELTAGVPPKCHQKQPDQLFITENGIPKEKFLETCWDLPPPASYLIISIVKVVMGQNKHSFIQKLFFVFSESVYKQ